MSTKRYIALVQIIFFNTVVFQVVSGSFLYLFSLFFSMFLLWFLYLIEVKGERNWPQLSSRQGKLGTLLINWLEQVCCFSSCVISIIWRLVYLINCIWLLLFLFNRWLYCFAVFGIWQLVFLLNLIGDDNLPYFVFFIV